MAEGLEGGVEQSMPHCVGCREEIHGDACVAGAAVRRALSAEWVYHLAHGALQFSRRGGCAAPLDRTCAIGSSSGLSETWGIKLFEIRDMGLISACGTRGGGVAILLDIRATQPTETLIQR